MHCQSPSVDTASLSTSLRHTSSTAAAMRSPSSFGALLVCYRPLALPYKLSCRPLIVRLAQSRSLLYPLNNSTCDAGISDWLVAAGNHRSAHVLPSSEKQPQKWMLAWILAQRVTAATRTGRFRHWIMATRLKTRRGAASPPSASASPASPRACRSRTRLY